MQTDFEQIYNKLFANCKMENFAGYDPFDGLNSTVFQFTRLNKIAPARLVFLQLVKRSPIDFRPLLGISKDTNPKGLALFALAELSRFRATGLAGHCVEAESILKQLAGLRLKTDGELCKTEYAAWGYNFDWQSRAFFAPCGTPTIVPTAFAAFAFLEAYDVLGNEEYLEVAKDVCVFITDVLNRPFEDENELCFSYTPLDRSIIFNASLLAGEVLARTGKSTGREDYLNLAAKTARFVISRQQKNGSWAYGSKLRHAWVDNFHTAYIIGSLSGMKSLSSLDGSGLRTAIRSGTDFWLDNFFLEDGVPKYYDQKTYPIDIHSAAAAIVVLSQIGRDDGRCLKLAEKVAGWVTENMLSENGNFYYQKNKFYSNRIEYMRWSNAWMAFALARLLETGENTSA